MQAPLVSSSKGLARAFPKQESLREFARSEDLVQTLSLPARAGTWGGRRVSCSAAENALLRIKRLQISVVSPDGEKIMEMVTNW
jgi:hypothetical protein